MDHMTSRRRTPGLILARVLTLLVFALTFDYWVYPYGAPMPAHSANVGENGLWLRYSWYFGEYSQAEVDALPARLKDDQIRYAYFHVRSTQHDGSLKFHCPDQARKLTSTLHRTVPGVKAIAWVLWCVNRNVLMLRHLKCPLV